MAASLALSDSTVTLPDGAIVEHAHLLVRDNRLRVRAEGHAEIIAIDVSAVEKDGRDKWRILTDDGVYFAQARECGCS